MRSGAGHQLSRGFSRCKTGVLVGAPKSVGAQVWYSGGIQVRPRSLLFTGQDRGPVRLAPPSLSEEPCPVHSSAESIYWYTEIRPRCCTAQSRTWSRGCQFSRHRRIASLQRFCSKFPWTCVDLLVAAQVRWTIRQLQQRNGAPLCARLATPRSRFIPTTES